MTFPRLIQQALRRCDWPRCTTLVHPKVSRCQTHRWHRAMELDRLWGEAS